MLLARERIRALDREIRRVKYQLLLINKQIKELDGEYPVYVVVVRQPKHITQTLAPERICDTKEEDPFVSVYHRVDGQDFS